MSDTPPSSTVSPMSTLARNPWVAVDVATDPLAHARLLRRAHERGVGGEALSGEEVRTLVAASWRRSLAAGVAPDAPGAPVRLTGDELEAAREASGLAPAIETILQTLSIVDSAAQHVVAIGDAQANLLWIAGDPHTVDRAGEMHFSEGASWSESATGTNAVGTAVVLDHPVQIFSAEHLVAVVHPWTCSGAPIHDPVSGELIGVVDLTADLRTAHPHTLSLAALAAKAAEAKLRADALERAARQGGSPGGSLLRPRVRTRAPRLRLRLLGRDAGARLGSAPPERALRSLELLAVLAMHREGLSSEQLALALYGERGKAVTIRAQVHRVRARVGEQMLRTNPYRLTGSIEADWLEVGRLIAAGRPAAALHAYRGPLLPESEAPAIVEARDLLEESLRRSVLTTADPDLLARWLAHPAGADDLAAARALVAVLPAGDPRRAAATATAAAIARRLA
jgi:transcriptional regulator of acetoin/glycerol metabolism